MRYRIRVITLMAIAVAVFLFTMWMTEPQEVSGEVNSFTAKTMDAVGNMEVAPVQPQEPENLLGEPFLIRCTCYTWTGNQCRNGSWPVEGLSVAGKEEWLGKAIIMYSVTEDGGIGDFIGYFDFTDTGDGIDLDGDGRGETIRNGTSIDVYRDTLEGCYEWIEMYGDYVYIQVVDAAGLIKKENVWRTSSSGM